MALNRVIAWSLLLTVLVSEARISFQQQTWQATNINEDEEYGFALKGFQYKSFPIQSYALCWLECEKDENCTSLNYDTTTQNCSLNSQNKMSAPVYYTKRDNSFYRTMSHRKPTQGIWNKMNSNPVCFGCTDGSSSNFSIKYSGDISRIKLVHLSGDLFNCGTDNPSSGLSRWGCYDPTNDWVAIVITYMNNTVILPTKAMHGGNAMLAYRLPGYSGRSSPEIVMDFPRKLRVSVGERYGIWHGQDYTDFSTANNVGSVCVDVYLFGIFA